MSGEEGSGRPIVRRPKDLKPIIGATVAVTVTIILIWTLIDVQSAWVVKTASNSLGNTTLVDIAIDDLGGVHVLNAWNKDGYESLQYREEGGGSYQFTGGAFVGYVAGFALDVDDWGAAHMAVVGPSAESDDYYLAYYHYGGPADFGGKLIDFGVAARPPSVAVDQNGHIHIAYSKNGSLMYATDAWGAWSNLTLLTIEPPGVGTEQEKFWSAIGVDSKGAVHVGYLLGNGAMGYISNASGEWRSQTVYYWGIGGESIDLVVDSEDHIHACFFGNLNESGFGLLYGVNVGSGWDLELAEVSGDGGRGALSSCSIAVDEEDSPRMAHVYIDDRDVYQVTYLARHGEVWKSTSVISTKAGTASCSLALDPDGVPYVGFESGGLARYATDALSIPEQLTLAIPGIALACIVAAVGVIVLLKMK